VSSPTRFTAVAASRFRTAIAEAGGIELFAIGKVGPERQVTDLEVHCRGQIDAVPALLKRPRAGEVVIHNHPSGVVQASDADMRLAGLYGDDGVGVVITNNAVTEALWVVEPHVTVRRPVDPAQVRRFFEGVLPRVMPGHEPRPAQTHMATQVASALSEPHTTVLEAGTGTGKSLAYLLPAAIWAIRNESRVAISTYTITLQGQLATADLPVLERAGMRFRAAVLKGRSNYLCRRKLSEVLARLDDGESPADAQTLRTIGRFAEVAKEGSRHDLAVQVDQDTWEKVASDHDQTLRARCPHYDRCFYYQARRRAADAQVLVVNHHLLLADLALKAESGSEGILPRYDRAVLDEAHHLEDAATSLFHQRLTARSISRACGPLLDRRRGGKGALSLLRDRFVKDGPLDAGGRRRAGKAIRDSRALLKGLPDDARSWMEQIAADALDDRAGVATPVRITPEYAAGEGWRVLLLPTLVEARRRLVEVTTALGRLEAVLDDLPPPARSHRPQPLFDLARARRRLSGHADVLAAFCDGVSDPDAPEVRWIERARDKRSPAPTASLCLAPVEVGPTLQEQVFAHLAGAVLTSATLAVDGRFDHFMARVGLTGPPGAPAAPPSAVFPSPFDYAQQALLAVPTDLPLPGEPGWEAACLRVITGAIERTGGGVFVLCTSYGLIDRLHRGVQAALGGRHLLLRQGEMGRSRLLDRFRQSGDAVLFGTDSFWEGVSVRGRALRLVLIPRLPFRVPTDPVEAARHERIAARGDDPFQAYSLPQAVLRLRQGFGRLIRSRTDRGAVVVLDTRVVRRRYGAAFLHSLPPARRVLAPTDDVLDALTRFSGEPG